MKLGRILWPDVSFYSIFLPQSVQQHWKTRFTNYRLLSQIYVRYCKRWILQLQRVRPLSEGDLRQRRSIEERHFLLDSIAQSQMHQQEQSDEDRATHHRLYETIRWRTRDIIDRQTDSFTKCKWINVSFLFFDRGFWVDVQRFWHFSFSTKTSSISSPFFSPLTFCFSRFHFLHSSSSFHIHIQYSAFSFQHLAMHSLHFWCVWLSSSVFMQMPFSFPLSFSTRQTIHSHTLTHSDTLILAPMTTSSFSCFSLFAFRIQLSLVVISRTRCTFNPSPNPSHCLFWPPRLMVTCPTSHYFPAASAAVLHRRWAASPSSSSSIQTLTRFLVSFHFIFFSLRGLSFLFLWRLT